MPCPCTLRRHLFPARPSDCLLSFCHLQSGVTCLCVMKCWLRRGPSNECCEQTPLELVFNFQLVGCVLETVLDGARQFWECRPGCLSPSSELQGDTSVRHICITTHGITSRCSSPLGLTEWLPDVCVDCLVAESAE